MTDQVRCVAIALAGLGFAGCAPAPPSVSHHVANDLPLRVELAATADTVCVGEFPEFRLRVTNVGRKPIRIPRDLQRWGFFASVLPSGKPATYTKSLRVDFDGSLSDTMVLPAGSDLEVEFGRHIAPHEPGNWTILWTLVVPRGTPDVALVPGRKKSARIVVTARPCSSSGP